MMTLRDRLRALVESAPAGTMVPVSGLADLLDIDPEAEPDPFTTPDLTVSDVAERFDKAVTTVRDWCRAGRFEGAYRLNDREWRIPPASVEVFIEAQRKPDTDRWAS